MLADKVVAGGQKHMFMETHAAVAVPAEDEKMVLTCGMQDPQLVC